MPTQILHDWTRDEIRRICDLPASGVRLAAGRRKMPQQAVALCFLAGANSIFTGEKLLATPNPAASDDYRMLENLGMKAMQSA
jgi:biotin synthase